MNWLRWHHGTSSDPKWRVIAKITGIPVPCVIAIWTSMLESASANDSDRGVLCGWEPEDTAASFDMETAQITAVYEAMQGRLLDGNRLISWDKRNPKRERDDYSTERVQRHREQSKNHETPCNATEHPDKRREEEIRKEEKKKPPKPPSGAFAGLWEQYPNRIGRKAAEKHYGVSVITEADRALIEAALANYLKHLNSNPTKAIQNGSTWFNNWRDWVNWIEPPARTAGNGNVTVVTPPSKSKFTEEQIRASIQDQFGDKYKGVVI